MSSKLSKCLKLFIFERRSSLKKSDGFIYLLSYQPRVSVTSCFVYNC